MRTASPDNNTQYLTLTELKHPITHPVSSAAHCSLKAYQEATHGSLLGFKNSIRRTIYISSKKISFSNYSYLTTWNLIIFNLFCLICLAAVLIFMWFTFFQGSWDWKWKDWGMEFHWLFCHKFGITCSELVKLKDSWMQFVNWEVILKILRYFKGCSPLPLESYGC